VPKKNYAAVVAAQNMPQTQQARPDQVKNDAGGYVFEADMWTRLNRFLVLGAESDSYYVGAEQKTFEAYKIIQDALKADGKRAVDMAVAISQGGIAPKNDPALWLMAMACAPKYASDDVNAYALTKVRLVARTLSFLYTFLDMALQSRGWGRGLRNMVAGWFQNAGYHNAAYQVIKYRQRNGWSARDVLRLAHVPIIDREMNAIFRWLTSPEKIGETHSVKRVSKDATRTVDYPPMLEYVPEIIRAYSVIQAMWETKTVLETSSWEQGEPSDEPMERMMGTMKPVVQKKNWLDEIVRLITKFDLTWEMLPTELLNEKAIWAALLPHLPYTALMRNLAKMTSVGLFADRTRLALVCERLRTEKAIIDARIHPINVLAASMTYAQGHGMKGNNTWTPEQKIIDALDDAFQLAFKAVEPTGQRILVALDISGSMTAKVNGMDYLSCAQAGTALAVSILGIEPEAESVLFDTEPRVSALSPRNRLKVSMDYIHNHPSGGTDCAAPFLYALDRLDKGQIDRMYDAVILLTDMQTWVGETHVYKAIEDCRKRNPKMRVVEVALEANRFTIEPENPLTLRIAGLDGSAPNLVSEFLRGHV